MFDPNHVKEIRLLPQVQPLYVHPVIFPKSAPRDSVPVFLIDVPKIEKMDI